MNKTRLLGIVSAADKETARAAIEAAGWGAHCFCRALVPAGGPDNVDPTHWLCDWQPDQPSEWGRIKAAVAPMVTWHNEGTQKERKKNGTGPRPLMVRLGLKYYVAPNGA